MFEAIEKFYASLDPAAAVIMGLAVILICGYLLTRLTKLLKLPNVTGYIIAGIIIGPYCLRLVPADLLSGTDFVTDIALAFIAFGVGKYFKFEVLKASGPRIIIITLFEALLAGAVITMSMLLIFKMDLGLALMLGAIGSATAPASTIMTIRQYHAKGDFVNTVLQVVALDDAVSLLAFSVCASVVGTMEAGGAVDVWSLLSPLVYNLAMIAAGIALGLLLKVLISKRRSRDSRLIILIAVILALTGACSALRVSPLLACMALGASYINAAKDKELFHQLNDFTPPVMCLFFVMSGARLNIGQLATVGIVGVAYFLIRIVGKYAGASLGAVITKSPKATRRYLGLALIPQAGVAIGLAALGQRILGSETGATLSTIILSSSVLYEMLGPACAKLSLKLSGAIPSPDLATPETVTVTAVTSSPAETPAALPEESPIALPSSITVTEVPVSDAEKTESEKELPDDNKKHHLKKLRKKDLSVAAAEPARSSAETAARIGSRITVKRK